MRLKLSTLQCGELLFAQAGAYVSLQFGEQLRGHLLFLAKHGSLGQAERARRMLVRALRVRGVLFRGERGETYRSAADWLASAPAKTLLESRG